MNKTDQNEYLENVLKENEELKIGLAKLQEDYHKVWKEKQDELGKRMHYQYAFECIMEWLNSKK